MNLFCLITLLTLVSAPTVLAGGIRTIQVNASKMASINLAMGQSTVLRFDEKPEKVVVGNQNYFSVEFIDKDLTIQPQGIANSNLFVYGKHGNVYGFNLKVNGGNHYDDLVNVQWRYGGHYKVTGKSSVSKISKIVNETIKLGNIKFQITRVINLKNKNYYLIDGKISNSGLEHIDLAKFKMSLSRSSKQLSGYQYAFSKQHLPSGRTATFRLAFKQGSSDAFRLHILYGNLSKSLVISQRWLR